MFRNYKAEVPTNGPALPEKLQAHKTYQIWAAVIL